MDEMTLIDRVNRLHSTAFQIETQLKSVQAVVALMQQRQADAAQHTSRTDEKLTQLKDRVIELEDTFKRQRAALKGIQEDLQALSAPL